jgi:predicted transcriptional regulator
MSDNSLTELTADIVSAYVSQNQIPADQVAALIATTYGALTSVANGAPEPVAVEAQKPAVSIKKSITPDYLISLEDGQQYKSLKRHLRTKYNMSPEDYRAKWNLPKDYPMVAPAYAASRSALAKSMGLGRGGARKAAPPAKPGRKPRSAAAT